MSENRLAGRVALVTGANHGIGAALGGPHLGPGKLPHEAEDEVEDDLVVAFGLIVELVGDGGEEGAEASEERVNVASA